jgi:phosphomethylpyrimidine synthase
MKISQEVRDFAAAKQVSEEDAIAVGMEEKAADFRAGGSTLYVSPEGAD